ncbi:MAG: 2-dehydropantoate 2-reductase [Spirochaetes bacterium]|nr:2-dehydropantoate 2-reductase [Spirochaetota bacterium]
MVNDNLTVGVVGCGSLGGVIAGKLFKKHGRKLWIVSRNRRINGTIRDKGLVVVEGKVKEGKVEGGKTITTAKPLVVESPADIDNPLDVVIVTTKLNTLNDAVKTILPCLSESGKVVLIQNGLEGLNLKEKFGADRIFIASVLWGASMTEPGRYRVTARGPFAAEKEKGSNAASNVLAEIFPVKLTCDIKGVLWSKLAVTASLTSLGAVTGMPFGKLTENRRILELSLKIGNEVYAVARKSGVRLKALPGVPFGINIPLLLAGKFLPQKIKYALIRLIGKKHGETESSMLASLKHGRKTEIDYLNGEIVKLGESFNTETPVNRRVVEIVKMLEEGRLKPDPDNLSLFRSFVR